MSWIQIVLQIYGQYWSTQLNPCSRAKVQAMWPHGNVPIIAGLRVWNLSLWKTPTSSDHVSPSTHYHLKFLSKAWIWQLDLVCLTKFLQEIPDSKYRRCLQYFVNFLCWFDALVNFWIIRHFFKWQNSKKNWNLKYMMGTCDFRHKSSHFSRELGPIFP